MAFKTLDSNYKPPIISRDKNFKMAVFADFHMASRTGYLPHGCKHERGEDHPQTTDQKKMEKKLLDSLNKVGTVDVVSIMGDMFEGKNSKAGGLDVGNVNTDIQVEWGLKAMKSICDILKPKYILGLSGSNYHIENSLDRRLLYSLSLTYPHTNVYFGNNLKFILGDKLWFLNHKSAEGVSKAGTLERYWNKMYSKSYGRERVPEVIGYAHLHQALPPVPIKNGENPVYGFFAPCQKMPDSFAGKGPMGTYWDIGYLLMEQQEEELSGKYISTYKYWKRKQ